MNRRAFTLTELLVVVGIIAIILAMVIPAILRVRGAADSLLCKSNLKQLGTALHHYHNDYGRVPPGTFTKKSPINMHQLGWGAHLLPYIEEDSLWKLTVSAFEKNPIFYAVPPH